MDISIIVIMFNPVLSKLYQTLDSIVLQKGVTYEIIICDDGSERRYEKELRTYFTRKQFSLYTLLFHNHHQGTVANFYSGLEKAKGKYTKIISPGDYLAGEDTLSKWFQFAEEKNAPWSFADAYYYQITDGNKRFIRKRAHPQIIRPYLKEQKNKCIWAYIVFRDMANGAATLGRTDLLLSYCKMIKDRGILYAEDAIYPIMMFHGIVGCYYPHEAICYEYGTGISSSEDAEWRAKLQNDRKIKNQIMTEEADPTDFQKAIQKTIPRTKKTEKIIIRGKKYHWFKWHFFPRIAKIPEEAKRRHHGRSI